MIIVKIRFAPALLGVLAFLAVTGSFTSPCHAITKRALLIGINDYKNLPCYSPVIKRDLENLEGAVNDVNRMKNILIGRFGFRADDILILRNEQATRMGILNAFDNWLIRGTRAGDTVFFHFSGHGTQVADQNGDEDDGLDEALCAHEVKPNGAKNIVDAGVILDDELGVLFRKLDKRSVTAFIDACHSGSVTRLAGGKPVATLEPTPAYRSRYIPVDVEMGSARGKDAPLSNIPRQTDIPPGQIFLFSSQENQLSKEVRMPDGTFHGALTLGIADSVKSRSNPTYLALYKLVTDFVKNRLQLEQDPKMEPQEGNILSKKVLTSLIDPLPPAKKATAGPAVKTTAPERQGKKPTPVPIAPRVSATPSQLKAIKKTASVRTQEPARRAEIDAEDDKLSVRIDDVKGLTPENTERLEKYLAGLDYVQLTKQDFFDRMIRGEAKGGVFHVRLVNRVGDSVRISPTENIDALVRAISTQLQADIVLKQFARLHNPHPLFSVRVWVNDEKRNNFFVGEKVEFFFSSERDCYVLMFNRDAEGNLTVLFPNAYHPNNFVRGGETIKIPDSGMNFELRFFEPAGEEMVKVIAAREPLQLEHIGIDDLNALKAGTGKKKGKDIFVTLRVDAGSVTRSIRPVQRLKERLSSGKFVWSDAMTIIRSYPKN